MALVARCNVKSAIVKLAVSNINMKSWTTKLTRMLKFTVSFFVSSVNHSIRNGLSNDSNVLSSSLYQPPCFPLDFLLFQLIVFCFALAARFNQLKTRISSLLLSVWQNLDSGMSLLQHLSMLTPTHRFPCRRSMKWFPPPTTWPTNQKKGRFCRMLSWYVSTRRKWTGWPKKVMFLIELRNLNRQWVTFSLSTEEAAEIEFSSPHFVPGLRGKRKGQDLLRYHVNFLSSRMKLGCQ